MPLDGNSWACPMNPHSALHSSCMTGWHLSLRIAGRDPTCPLCQQIVPWICDLPEPVVVSEVVADEDAVSDDDSLEVEMLLLDTEILLATAQTTPDLDAMLNDVTRLLPRGPADLTR